MRRQLFASVIHVEVASCKFQHTFYSGKHNGFARIMLTFLADCASKCMYVSVLITTLVTLNYRNGKFTIYESELGKIMNFATCKIDAKLIDSLVGKF